MSWKKMRNSSDMEMGSHTIAPPLRGTRGPDLGLFELGNAKEEHAVAILQPLRQSLWDGFTGTDMEGADMEIQKGHGSAQHRRDSCPTLNLETRGHTL